MTTKTTSKGQGRRRTKARAYAPSITKEALAALPVAKFPGRIELVESKRAMRDALKVLRKCDAIGMDTETKPSFKPGQRYEVSLLQLATDEVCYLFRLNKIGFAQELVRLIENPKILKIGLSLRDDKLALRRLAPLEADGLVELQRLCPGYGIRDESLQKIYGIMFGEYMSKGARMSNWQAQQLSAAQEAYAALDAWACLRIYRQLMQLAPPDPTRFAILY